MIKLLTVTLLTATTFQIFDAVQDFQTNFPQPLAIKEDVKLTETRLALRLLNAPPEKLDKLTKACYSAGLATDIDPILIASIIPKESNFKVQAKSNKGYKGLMQTNKAEMRWSRAGTDVMKGAEILREKIDIAKGNVDKGMVFYKGSGGKESQAIAKDQMEFYRKLREQVKTNMKG